MSPNQVSIKRRNGSVHPLLRIHFLLIFQFWTQLRVYHQINSSLNASSRLHSQFPIIEYELKIMERQLITGHVISLRCQYGGWFVIYEEIAMFVNTATIEWGVFLYWVAKRMNIVCSSLAYPWKTCNVSSSKRRLNFSRARLSFRVGISIV